MAKLGQKSAWETKIEPRLDEIAGWCREGLTDKQIAELLGICEATFYKHKAVRSELVDALKINKNIADLRVVDSLYQRAIGYEYIEEVTEAFVDGRKVKDSDDVKKVKPDTIRTKKIKRFMPPDVTAQIFWLKNRQPGKWRDKKHAELIAKGDGLLKITPTMEPTKAVDLYIQMIQDDKKELQ